MRIVQLLFVYLYYIFCAGFFPVVFFGVVFFVLYFFVLYFLCCIFSCFNFCYLLYKINVCYINWMRVIFICVVLTLYLFKNSLPLFWNYFLFIQNFRFAGVVFFVMYFSCYINVLYKRVVFFVLNFSCFNFLVISNYLPLNFSFPLFWNLMFLLSGYMCLPFSL